MCAVILALVLPVSAQEIPVSNSDSSLQLWENPNTFPLKVDFDTTEGIKAICALHSDVLTDEQCVRGADNFEKRLFTDYFLQDGDIFEVSFTSSDGRHKKETLKVWFGADVPPDDPRRKAEVYDTGRPDGVKLIKPLVCGNWGLMTFATSVTEIIREIKVIERVIVEQPKAKVYRCGLQAHPHRHMHRSGTQTTGYVYEVCDTVHYLPGIKTEPKERQSNGHGQSCGFVDLFY